MHEGDRGYLHSQIAANAVQGSSTATGSHEGEGGAWRLPIFSFDSRRADIPRQDSLTRGSGRPMAPTQGVNVRPWFGSAVSACAIHSFLGGGNKQPVDCWPTKTGTTPPASPTRRWTEGPLLADCVEEVCELAMLDPTMRPAHGCLIVPKRAGAQGSGSALRASEVLGRGSKEELVSSTQRAS